MPSILALLLLIPFATGTPALAASNLVRCSGTAAPELCIPSIGQGNRLILPLPSERDAAPLGAGLRNRLAPISPAGATPRIVAPESPAEQELAREFGVGKLLDVTSFFPQWIAERFNRGAGFGGPNCYNTALIAAGLLPRTEVRYVAQGEFELYLNTFTNRVQTAQPGDLVVFRANSTRDHAALYLFGDLVFHKKGYQNGYTYRISPVHAVDEKEPFEWQPPIGRLFDPANAPGLRAASGQLAFYRKHPNFITPSPPQGAEQVQVLLIEFLTRATLDAAPNWKIAENLGLITEQLLESLVREFAPLANSRSLVSRLSYQRLISLRDQVFQSIEDTHFSSPYASSKRDKINEMICVSYNEFLTRLITLLLESQGRPAEPRNIEAVLSEIRTYDRKQCRIPLLELIRD